MSDWSKGLLVMPEYHTSGIWELEDDGIVGATLDFEQLNLPASLERRFRSWIRELGDPWDSEKDFDSERVINTGRQLATELKRFLGDAIAVEFQQGRERIKIELS